jgi:leucyl aminopeptidase
VVHINAVPGDIATTAADAMVVNLFEGVTAPEGGTSAVDKALDGAISSLIEDGEISGKKGETTLIHTFGRIPTKRVVVLGLGKQDKFDSHVVRDVSASVARYLRKLKVKKATSLAHGASIGNLSPRESAQATAEGTLLGLYRFDRYLSKNGGDDDKELEELTIIEQDGAKLDALNEGITSGTVLAQSAQLVRDMVNEPPNVMFPERMAEIAVEVAKETGLDCKVLGIEDMQLLGMGALLGVTAGSAREPKLIILQHNGDPEHPEDNIAFAGKGITFDTGGISLKPAANMGNMKSDMGGGASVIGAMRAIGMLKPNINVIGIVPAVENMPGGRAQRPGDIVRAMNGKTIEVDNTDAEGRLVLADAISYAIQEIKAKRVVDIATLTGAMVTALGNVTTGVMGRSQTLVDALLEASYATGEKMWQMPLFDEYKSQNKSDWADVKNTGGAPAGSITAALFISEFTEGIEWAHMDIAGTALSSKESGHIVKGATGVPMRTLVRLVQDMAAAKDV